MKEFATKFYHSGAWLDCRGKYIQSVLGLCSRCNGIGYIVHHKITLTPDNINDPNVTLNWNELEYLCLDCHNKEHGVGSSEDVIREGLTFDNEGNVIKIDDNSIDKEQFISIPTGTCYISNEFKDIMEDAMGEVIKDEV
jgi:hypothetical protein